MALVSICVLPNHATFMTDTLDATFVTSSYRVDHQNPDGFYKATHNFRT